MSSQLPNNPRRDVTQGAQPDSMNDAVLEGADLSPSEEARVANPYRGMVDPAVVRKQPALNFTSSTRFLIAGVVAAAVVSAVLLALFAWNAAWATFGIAFAITALAVMWILRAVDMQQKMRLRTDALLLAAIWTVPLAIAFTIFFSGVLASSTRAAMV